MVKRLQSQDKNQSSSLAKKNGEKGGNYSSKFSVVTF